MLFAHKVLDALLERGHRHRLIGSVESPNAEQRARLVQLIEHSQKFDFGVLPLPLINSEEGKWRAYDLTEDEKTAWAAGLLPLPFPVCWFEFVLGVFRSALLVMEPTDEEIIYTQRFDLIGDEVNFDGFVATLSRDSVRNGHMEIGCSGDAKLLAAMQQAGKLSSMVAANPPLALYLTLMLHSRSTEIGQLQQPEKFLNRKRISKGLTPLPAHRVVHIVPPRWHEQAQREAAAERRLPRLHWRRSHLRHFDHQTGNAKYVPSLVHNGTEGWWVTVIPRMLVGKADLGTVTHEYRIEQAARLTP